MSVVPISGTKELASPTACIVWHTRSNTFVLFPLLELTLAVAQHHAGFIFEITLVREIYCPPVLGGHCDTVAMLATTVALAPQRSAVRPIRNVGRGHAGAWSARPIYFTAVLNLYTFTVNSFYTLSLCAF